MDTHVGLNVAIRVCDVYPDKCWFAVLCRFCLQYRPRGNWYRHCGRLVSTLFSPRLNYIKNNYFLTKSKTFPKANSLISEGLLQWQCAVLLCATNHTKTFTAIEG